MAKQKEKQKMRYGSDELAIIKSIYSDNFEVLLALRKLFLQAPLSKEDKELLKMITGNKEAINLLKKTFAPVIEADAPISQIIDLWMTVDTKDKDALEIDLELKTREILIKFNNDGFKRLESSDLKPIGTDIINYKPDFKADVEERVATHKARNAFLSHVENQLQQIYILGQKKDETPEELQARLAKDSAK